jgi:hypothetical protein
MYRFYETASKIDDKRKTVYLLIVFHSEELAGTKQQTLEKRWTKTKAILQKELASLEKTAYSCEVDERIVREEAIRFIYEKGFLARRSVILATMQHRTGRGRPKKDGIPSETPILSIGFHLTCTLYPAFAEREQQQVSCFVLIFQPRASLPQNGRRTSEAVQAADTHGNALPSA